MIPTTTIAALMTIVEFRALAMAWSMGFRLKPRYSDPTDTLLNTSGTAKSITLPCFGSTYGVTWMSPAARGSPFGRWTRWPICARSWCATTLPSASAKITYRTSGSFMASWTRRDSVRSSFDRIGFFDAFARSLAIVRPRLVISFVRLSCS